VINSRDTKEQSIICSAIILGDYSQRTQEVLHITFTSQCLCVCLNYTACKIQLSAQYTVISPLASLTVSYFSLFICKGQAFRKKKYPLHDAYVLIFLTNLPETFLIPVTNQQDQTINALCLACKVPNIVFRF
jgi:hypothetical protein